MRPLIAIRDSVKKALAVVVPARLYTWIATKYYWATVFLNYRLMRSALAMRAWPKFLDIEGTNICNAACVFCAYPLMERKKVTMPMDTFKRTILEYTAAGGRRIELTPIVGDPFVDRHFFERMDFLDGLAEVERIEFYSNAILMKPEHAGRLLAYGEKLWINISFGGFDRERYKLIMGVDRYDVVIANVRALIAAKRKSGSKTHVELALRNGVAECKGEFWKDVEAARDEGLMTVANLEGWGFDSWAGMIKEEDLIAAGLEPRKMPVKHGPCHRLITNPVVLADGRVNACGCRDVEAQLIIGDTSGGRPLADILRGPELHDLLEKHEREDFPDVCKKCTYYESLYPDWMTQSRFWPLYQKLFSGSPRV